MQTSRVSSSFCHAQLTTGLVNTYQSCFSVHSPSFFHVFCTDEDQLQPQGIAWGQPGGCDGRILCQSGCLKCPFWLFINGLFRSFYEALFDVCINLHGWPTFQGFPQGPLPRTVVVSQASSQLCFFLRIRLLSKKSQSPLVAFSSLVVGKIILALKPFCAFHAVEPS